MNILNEIKAENVKELSEKTSASTKELFKKLKKKKHRNLDDIVHKLHDEAFDVYDCLDCANCCKSISPALYDRDIERLAKQLRMKPSKFVEQYLELDTDGAYMFRQTPCPFLMGDNYCMVYEQRPKACREYPHTDRKRFYQILNISYKNTAVCPVVYAIAEELKVIFK